MKMALTALLFCWFFLPVEGLTLDQEPLSLFPPVQLRFPMWSHIRQEAELPIISKMSVLSINNLLTLSKKLEPRRAWICEG